MDNPTALLQSADELGDGRRFDLTIPNERVKIILQPVGKEPCHQLLTE